jgi:hypothetical protein
MGRIPCPCMGCAPHMAYRRGGGIAGPIASEIVASTGGVRALWHHDIADCQTRALMRLKPALYMYT